nr:uncharacterized protein LOC109622513 [Aedes albopictus]
MDTKAEEEEEEEEEVLYEELDADSVDTVNLLSSFGLADSIISNFLENGYTVDLLKEVERQEIEELIGHPFLAERTKFISGLNKWREGQGLPPVSTPSGGSAGCTEGRLENINRQDCTAKLLINASPKGRAVIQSYKDTNVLTRSQKRIITHIVVDEFKDRFGKLTRHELVLRAAELRQLFPTESEYTWYQPAVEFQGSKKIKLGKLAKGCLHDSEVGVLHLRFNCKRWFGILNTPRWGRF